ncbi:MAG TPA: glycerol-3-phosphate 1-O-acyltransferase PlsY [Paralcaligenes sp.]
MTSIIYFAAGLSIILTAYILGSIPFAVVISRVMGLQDPRSFGSKNPGATNVLRTGNKTAAALTLLGDGVKGWLAVWLATGLAQRFELSDAIVGLAAIAVFLGHVYPIFLKFKGGKGVATTLGVLFAIQPWLGAATVATWLIVAYATKYSSVAAITSALFAPAFYLFGGNVAWEFSATLCLSIAIISAMLIHRHRANISRLMTGQEGRIGAKKKG